MTAAFQAAYPGSKQPLGKVDQKRRHSAALKSPIKVGESPGRCISKANAAVGSETAVSVAGWCIICFRFGGFRAKQRTPSLNLYPKASSKLVFEESANQRFACFSKGLKPKTN